jgi:hypothetical protein
LNQVSKSKMVRIVVVDKGIKTELIREELYEVEDIKCSRCKQIKPASLYGINKATQDYYKTCNKCRGVSEEDYEDSIREANILQYKDKERACTRCRKVKEAERFGERQFNGKTYSNCLVCRGLELPPPKPIKIKKPGRECTGCGHPKTEEEFGGLKKNGKSHITCLTCRQRYREPTEEEIKGDFILSLDGMIWCNGCIVYKKKAEYPPEKDESTPHIRCLYCREKTAKREERDKCACGINKYDCRQCGDGIFCPHSKRKNTCGICTPDYYCNHNVVGYKCKYCSPIAHLVSIVRGTVYKALKSNKKKKSIEYLGCSAEEYKVYLENLFTRGMTWENYGTLWEVDHIIPLMYKKPTLEQIIERLHYTNTQPLGCSANRSKGNKFIG